MLRSAGPPLRSACFMLPFSAEKMSSGYLQCHDFLVSDEHYNMRMLGSWHDGALAYCRFQIVLLSAVLQESAPGQTIHNRRGR